MCFRAQQTKVDCLSLYQHFVILFSVQEVEYDALVSAGQEYLVFPCEMMSESEYKQIKTHNLLKRNKKGMKWR